MADPRNQLLSWCEIDTAALAHNLALLRSLLPGSTRVLLVIKSNAYGHGLPLIASRAEEAGVGAVGTHTVDEAAAARAAGFRGMILIMGYVQRSRLGEAVALGADLTVFDPSTCEELDRIGRSRGEPVPCHLKLETGTHRQGILEEELPVFLERFASSPGLRLAGLSTHFANIEDTTDRSYARSQLERFRRMTEQARAAGFDKVVLHAACTAAALTMPETGFDLARIGIGAYGLWPSRETLASSKTRGEDRLVLRPVLSWKARVSQVKWVPAGSFVGYGCTHRTGRRTRIAVIPVGYADGYARHLSGLSHVLIGGQRASVLGRICMNMFMVDATDLEAVETEQEVVLIGRQGAEAVTASDLSSQAQTIPYEIVSRIAPGIPRLAVDERGRLL